MITTQTVTWRLQRLGIDSLDSQHDMTNAFMCPKKDRVMDVYERRAGQTSSVFFRQKVLNTLVTVPTIDGRVDAMPGTGFLMGDKVAPNGFNESFCSAVERAEEILR